MVFVLNFMFRMDCLRCVHFRGGMPPPVSSFGSHFSLTMEGSEWHDYV